MDMMVIEGRKRKEGFRSTRLISSALHLFLWPHTTRSANCRNLSDVTRTSCSHAIFRLVSFKRAYRAPVLLQEVTCICLADKKSNYTDLAAVRCLIKCCICLNIIQVFRSSIIQC